MWLKAVSLATCIFFTSTDILKAEISVTASSAIKTPSAVASREIPVSSVDIPPALGERAKSYQGKSDQIIVIIQDAHANYEAQKNIAALLTHLAEKNGLRTVNVEGAQGYLYHSFLSAYPSREARRAMADYFMKEAKLTGPEYAAIVDQPALKLFGVEDEALYQENRRVFLEALDYKGQDEVILAGIRKLLDNIGKKVFSKDLYELIKRGEDFRRENKNMISFIDFLNQFSGRFGVDMAGYGQIRRFLELNELHSAINEIEVEKEAEALVKALGSLPADVKKPETLKDRFPALVLEAIRQRVDLAAYPQATIFSQSMEIQKKIDVSLFDEIQKLNEELRQKLFQNEDERALERLFKIVEIYEKIFDFSLTRDDADFFFANRRDFQMANFRTIFSRFEEVLEWNGGFPEEADRIDKDLARIEKFYELALKRDSVLVEKTLSELQAGGDAVIALIAGGFHTAGFQRVLEEKNISHITVRPAITELKNAEEQNRLYEQSVRQEPEAFAQLLVKDYSRQKSPRLNDPRYQLAAHKILFSQDEVAKLLGEAGKADLSQYLLSNIEQNPRIGANMTLALFTVLMDIRQAPEAFNARQELETLLSAAEDLELRRAVYGFLLSDQTKIYKLRNSKDGLKVILGERGLVATIEPFRQPLGVSAREVKVKDDSRWRIIKAAVGGDLYVIKRIRDELDKVELELERMKAGDEIAPKTVPSGPEIPKPQVPPVLAASLGAVEKINQLNGTLLPQIKALSAELSAANPSDTAALAGLASRMTVLRKQFVNATRSIDRAMDKEQLGDRTRQAIEREIENLDADLLVLNMKQNFMDYRNQLLALDIADTAAWDKLNRRIDALRETFNRTIHSSENQIDRITSQRPKKDSESWQEKQRRIAALVELRDQFPVQHLTQLRQYLALLRAVQKSRQNLLAGLSANPQEWLSKTAGKLHEAAAKAAQQASPWVESVKDTDERVQAYVKAKEQESIEPASKLADFVGTFRGAVELVNRAREVVNQTDPGVEALIRADKDLTEAKIELAGIIGFDLSGLPLDQAKNIRDAFKALRADRKALRAQYNAHAGKIKDAEQEAERLAKEAEERARQEEADSKKADAKRVTEIRKSTMDAFPELEDAEGIARQIADEQKHLAELSEIQGRTRQPLLPSGANDLSAEKVNKIAGLPKSRPPAEKLEAIKPDEVHAALQEAADRKETRQVSRGKVWTVVTKISGALFGWAIKGRKKPLTDEERESHRIANKELPKTRQPVEAVDEFLKGEGLPQWGNAQVLLQASTPANIRELLEKTWANDATAQEAKEELSQSLVRQWVLRQYAEWPQAVDLDTKFRNTGIFLRSDSKAYQVKNFDHDELIGMDATGQLTREQFVNFFYYFWAVQVSNLRKMDAELSGKYPAQGNKLETLFHDAVKQTGIFKTLYENPANVETLLLAFSGTYKYLKASEQEIEKRNGKLSKIAKELEDKQKDLADLRETSKRPGAPLVGAQIDALQAAINKLEGDFKKLKAQKSGAEVKHSAWFSYLEAQIAQLKIKDEFEGYVKARQEEQKKAGADRAGKYQVAARVNETLLESRTRRSVLEVLQTLDQAKSWKTYDKWSAFQTLDEKISHLESLIAGRPKTYYLQVHGVVRKARDRFNELYTPFFAEHFRTVAAGIVAALKFATEEQEFKGLEARFRAIAHPAPDSGSLAARFPAIADLLFGELSSVTLQAQDAIEIHEAMAVRKTLDGLLKDYEDGGKSIRKINEEVNRKAVFFEPLNKILSYTYDKNTREYTFTDGIDTHQGAAQVDIGGVSYNISKPDDFGRVTLSRRDTDKVVSESRDGIGVRIARFRSAVTASNPKTHPQAFWAASAFFNKQMEDFYVKILTADLDRIRGQFAEAKTGKDTQIVLTRLQDIATLAAAWEGRALQENKKTFSDIAPAVIEARSQFLNLMFEKRKAEVEILAGPEREIPLDAALVRLDRLNEAFDELKKAAVPEKDAELIRDITMYQLNNLSNAVKGLKALEARFQKDFLALLDKIDDTLVYPLQKAEAPAKRSQFEQALRDEWKELRGVFRGELKGHAEFQSAMVLAADLLNLRQAFIDFENPDAAAQVSALKGFEAKYTETVEKLTQIPLIGAAAAEPTGLKDAIQSRLAEAALTVAIPEIARQSKELIAEFKAFEQSPRQAGDAAKFLDFKTRADGLIQSVTDRKLGPSVSTQDLSILSTKAVIRYTQSWIREMSEVMKNPLSLEQLNQIYRGEPTLAGAKSENFLRVEAQFVDIMLLKGQWQNLKQAVPLFKENLERRIKEREEFDGLAAEVAAIKARYTVKIPLAELKETDLKADRALIEGLLSPPAQAGQPANTGKIQVFLLQSPERGQRFQSEAKKLAGDLSQAEAVRVIRLNAQKYVTAIAGVTSKPNPAAVLSKINSDFSNDQARLGDYAADVNALITRKRAELLASVDKVKDAARKIAEEMRALTAVIQEEMGSQKIKGSLIRGAWVLNQKEDQVRAYALDDAKTDESKLKMLESYVGDWKALLDRSQAFIRARTADFERLNQALEDTKSLALLQGEPTGKGKTIIQNFQSAWKRFADHYVAAAGKYQEYYLASLEFKPDFESANIPDEVIKIDQRVRAEIGQWPLLQAASLGEDTDKAAGKPSLGDLLKRKKLEAVEKAIREVRRSVNGHSRQLNAVAKSESGGVRDYRGILNELLFDGKPGKPAKPSYHDQVTAFQSESTGALAREAYGKAESDKFFQNLNQLSADIDAAAFLAVEQWIRALTSGRIRLSDRDRRVLELSEEEHARLAEFVQRYSERLNAMSEKAKAEKGWKAWNDRVQEVMDKALASVAPGAAGGPSAAGPPSEPPGTRPTETVPPGPPSGGGIGAWLAFLGGKLLANWKPILLGGTVATGVTVGGVWFLGGKQEAAPGAPPPGAPAGEKAKKDEGAPPGAKKPDEEPKAPPEAKAPAVPAVAPEVELSEAEKEFARRKAKLLEEHRENQKRQRQVQQAIEVREEMERMFPPVKTTPDQVLILGDPEFEAKWNADEAAKLEAAVRKELEDLAAQIKAAPAAEKAALEQKKGKLELRRDFLKDYHERIARLIASIAEYGLGPDQIRDEELRARMWQWTVDAFVRRTMGDRDEIRNLKAEVAVLEKEKKAKLAADKRGEADELQQQIQKVSGVIAKLENEFAKYKQDFETRKQEKEKRENIYREIYREVKGDKNVAPEKRAETVESKFKARWKAERDALELDRLKARALAGDEAAKKELARMDEVAANKDLQKLKETTRTAFDDRFLAQVRAGTRQEWEERYDWKETWQQALMDWYDKNVKDAAEKEKKKTEAALEIADNRLRWDTAKEDAAIEAELRRYRVEWKFEPRPVVNKDDELDYNRGRNILAAQIAKKQGDLAKAATPEGKKFYEREIAALEAEMERLAYMREFAEAYRKEFAKHKDLPNVRDRMLSFREQWLQARAGATTNALVKKELEQAVSDIQLLRKEIAEEKARGKTVREIELEDYFFRLMRRRYEGELRVLNKNLDAWAERIKALPAGNEERKGLEARVTENEEKRNRLERRLMDFLVDHEWKVARLIREDELKNNPDRFTEMMRFERQWLKTKIGQLDAAAKALEEPAKKDAAAQRQLDNTKAVRDVRQKRLDQVEARLITIDDRRITLNADLERIGQQEKAREISTRVAALLREKAHLDSQIRIKTEMAKKDPRLLAEIAALRLKSFNLDGFPYRAVDYPAFVEDFLVPWQKRLDALDKKLRDFNEKNVAKIPTDKKVRAEQKRIEEEIIRLRIDRMEALKAWIDRGDVEVVIPAVPPITTAVSAAATENLREASDLIQNDTLSVASVFPMVLSAEEKIEIDNFLKKMQESIDAQGLVIPELVEAGRWGDNEYWYRKISNYFSSRPSVVGGEAQPFRLRVLKFWNANFPEILKTASDPKYSALRAAYRTVGGAPLVEPLEEDSWREIHERNGSNLHLRLSLATLMGHFEEQVAVEEINEFQNQLSVLRIRAIYNWVYNNPIGRYAGSRAYLMLAANIYSGSFQLQQEELRRMRNGSELGNAIIDNQIAALQLKIDSLNQAVSQATVVSNQGDRYLAQALVNVSPLQPVIVAPSKKKGRVVLAAGATDPVMLFAQALNNIAEARNRLQPTLDIAYINNVNRYLVLADPQKVRTIAEDAEMIRIENELEAWHAGIPPYHANRRSSINILTWHLQYSRMDAQKMTDLAEGQARKIMLGVFGIADKAMQQGGVNWLAKWKDALQPEVGKEKGYTPNVMLPQLLQDYAGASADSPVLNQDRIKGDRELIKRRLSLIYDTYNTTALDQMSQAFLEDFMINDPSGLREGIKEEAHLRFINGYKEFSEKGGLRAFTDLRGKDYRELVDPKLKYFELFLSGNEKKLDPGEIENLVAIIYNVRRNFPPEDAMRIEFLLRKIELIEKNPGAYWTASKRALDYSVVGSLDGTTNPGALQDRLRRRRDNGIAGLKDDKISLKDQLVTLVATLIRRDVQTTLTSQMREARLRGIDTVDDVPDGRGGTKPGLLKRLKDQNDFKRDLEFFIFGPKLDGGKLLGEPARFLDLGLNNNKALMNTLEEGSILRGIKLETLRELLRKVAGEYRAPNDAEKEDMKAGRRPKADVIYPFQEAIWELNQRLNGNADPGQFPAKGWPRGTEKERREFVATVLSEAELYAELGPDEYRRLREELAGYLRKNPNAPAQALAAVHTATRDLKNAFRPDGKTIKPKAPKKLSEASGLERGMVRAILTAAAKPGGNLERELNRMRILGEISKNKDHLRKTIRQAQAFYERILGPEAKVPVINSQTILQSNLAFSRYADFLLMGIEERELPPPGGVAEDMARAVNAAILSWEDNIRKLNDHLAQHPLEREVMMNLAFLEVMAKKGWAPISEFDYDKGNYPVARDSEEFNKFRRQLLKRDFDVYTGYVKLLIREGLGEGAAAPAAPIPAPAPGAFDGRLPLVPGLPEGDAKRLSALPIPKDRNFPDGNLLPEQHAGLKWPVFVQREGQDAIHVFGFGRRQNTSGLIPGEVHVWNGETKKYTKFEIPVPADKRARQKFFRYIEKAKGAWEPRIPVASENGMADLMWKQNDPRKLYERVENVVWRKSLDGGETWFDALTLRADGTVLVTNKDKTISQEISLGLSGPQYAKMKVQHIKGMRVDDAGKLHAVLSLAGDRFTGEVYLTAAYQEATGAMEVNVKSAYSVRVTGKAKEDAQIAQWLNAPVDQLTVLRIGATPQLQESITYHTVNGLVTKKVYEPGFGEALQQSFPGNPDETYAATIKGQDGTLTEVKAAPVARPAGVENPHPLEARYSAGNRAQMPSNLPVQLTFGVPVPKKLEPGKPVLSDLTTTVTPKPKAAKVEDIKPADLKAPAGWPAVPRKAAPTVSEAAKRLREIEDRTNELMRTMLNREMLEAADNWYWALLYGKGKADPRPVDAKGYQPLVKFAGKTPGEIQTEDREAYGRIRAFMGKIAESEEKKLDEAVKKHIKQMDTEIATLADKEKRKLLIATSVFSDLAFRGNASEFITGLGEDDAVKALREKMAKDKMALFSQIMRTEEELKDVQLRTSTAVDGKVWIYLNGVRYEVGLKRADEFSLRTEAGEVSGPFARPKGTEITVGGRKYKVESVADAEIKLRAQGPVMLNDFLNFEAADAEPGRKLLEQMIDYFEAKILKTPGLQGKLSARVRAALEKGSGAPEWNEWIQKTLDGLLRLRGLAAPEGGAPMAGLPLLKDTEKIALAKFLDAAAEEERAAAHFVQAWSGGEAEEIQLAAEFEALAAATDQPDVFSAQFSQLEALLEASLNRINARTNVQLDNMLLQEQIAALTRQVETRQVDQQGVLYGLLDILDTAVQRSEDSLAGLDARRSVADIRETLALADQGIVQDGGSSLNALMARLNDELTDINVRLDSNLTDTMLRPLLAALGEKTDEIPAERLWDQVIAKTVALVRVQEVINTAGNMTLARAMKFADMPDEEQRRQEREAQESEIARFQRNADQMDALRQKLYALSNEQVTLTASLPVINHDGRTGFAVTQLSRIIENEALPPEGINVFLVDEPGFSRVSSGSEQKYTYSGNNSTVYLNVDGIKNPSQFTSAWRKAVETVTAIVDQNKERVEALSGAFEARSGGQITVQASNRILADTKKTESAVRMMDEILRTETLPSGGRTTIFVDDNPIEAPSSYTASTLPGIIPSAMSLNFGALEEGFAQYDLTKAFRTASKAASKQAIEAASLGAAEGLEAVGLTPLQQEALKAALDAKEEISKEVELAAAYFLAGIKPVQDPGLFLMDASKYYDPKNPQAFLDHVKQDLLELMPSQLIAISVDKTLIPNDEERASLLESLNILKGQNPGRLYVLEASLAASLTQLENMASELNLTPSDFRQAMQFTLLDKQITDKDLESALRTLGRYAAGRVVVLGDEDLTSIEGKPIRISVAELVRAWAIAREAAQTIARAA